MKRDIWIIAVMYIAGNICYGLTSAERMQTAIIGAVYVLAYAVILTVSVWLNERHEP